MYRNETTQSFTFPPSPFSFTRSILVRVNTRIAARGPYANINYEGEPKIQNELIGAASVINVIAFEPVFLLIEK